MAANLHEKSGHVLERIDKPSSSELNINDLPQEILEYIFSFLYIIERIKIERVCKMWRLIGTTIQSKVKEFKCEDSNLTDYMLEEILKRCGNTVLTIDLSYCYRLTSKALSIIGDHCPNLRTVIFSHWYLMYRDLVYFSNKYTKLKEAVLIDLRCGEVGLRSFLKSCQELEVLHILSNNNISGLCFQFISPKVKELKLSHCSRLTPEGVLQLGKCKCIEHLELNYCSGLDTASLQEVLKQNCKSLKHLRLIGNLDPWIHYQVLPFELLTKLESISFRHNHSIEDITLLEIMHKCKNLRTLDVSDTKITDVGLQHLTNCPLLTTLNVICTNEAVSNALCLLILVLYSAVDAAAIESNS